MERYCFLPLALFLALPGGAVLAQGSPVGSATRSDSIDLLHTRIELDLTNTDNGIIRGDASITFTPRVPGISKLPLDLLLPVDSVVMGSVQLPFDHPGEVLSVNLQNTYGPGDTLTLTVSYHGVPATDPSGFGGFYTLSNYQYDLGVAFDAVPHSYGRAWLPCFDNFVERCTLDFFVHTNGNRSVYANGTLVDTTYIGGGERISHWRINHPIPSYLASVAAGNYAALHDTFPSVAGAEIPVLLAALPSDTAQMGSSFIHLKNAFDTFEEWFGPYRWNRVGYVLTSAGAMEHATNICYPDIAADGTLGNEDLIAHELSHHWFGNLITCARPEEMYLNEGFADFCAKLFMGELYGPAKYMSLVRSNHHESVAKAHLVDGGWFALANVPQNVTYGETSYKKGADIARTLRSVMGDSLFSAGFKEVFNNNAYTAMGSTDLRDSLSAATGLDLTDFFNNWIFQPGGAAFMVDSFSVAPSGNLFNVQVHIRQKTRGGAAFFSNVPVTMACISATGEVYRETVVLGGSQSTASATCAFPPVSVRLNDDERLALATTLDTVTITAPGQKNLINADLWVLTSNLPAPTILRVEEFWVPADQNPSQEAPYFLSPDRWWRVEGNFLAGTDMKLRFTLDGRAGQFTAFDQGLTQDFGGTPFVEDSVAVLFRPNPSMPWMEMPATVTFLGSHTDKFARIDMPGLAAGDYALARRSLPATIQTSAIKEEGWRYFPDPASEQVSILAPPNVTVSGSTLMIRDMSGRTLGTHALHAGSTCINITRIKSQTVLLSIRSADGKVIRLGQLHIVH